MKKKCIPTMNLILGAALIVFGALPSVFPFPYSHGANSGPRNIQELSLMLSYDYWMWFLIVGIVVTLLSIIKLRRV